MNLEAQVRRAAAGYLVSLALVAVFTGVVAIIRELADVGNVSMVYLLAVIASAVAFGSRPAILAAVASFLAYDFFFIEPKFGGQRHPPPVRPVDSRPPLTPGEGRRRARRDPS